MKGKKVSTSSFRGAGSPMQLMKLIPDQQIEQGSAGSIDCKDMRAIQFLTDCNITLNGVGAAGGVKAGECYEVSDCDSVVPDVAISYRWM